MKKVNKTRVVMWIFALAPLVISAIMWNRLPDEIPINWGLDGEVSYGRKINLLYISGLAPVLAIMFMLLPKIDPRRKNYKKFRGFYDAFALFMMVFLLALVCLIISESLNPGRINVVTAIVAAIGLLFVFLGNIMPKFKSNFFAGIRTPWTILNSTVWNKTHRLAGYLFFFGGICIIALAFVLSDTILFVAFFVIIGIQCIIPAAMSYVWYKKLPESEKGN